MFRNWALAKTCLATLLLVHSPLAMGVAAEPKVSITEAPGAAYAAPSFDIPASANLEQLLDFEERLWNYEPKTGEQRRLRQDAILRTCDAILALPEVKCPTKEKSRTHWFDGYAMGAAMDKFEIWEEQGSRDGNAIARQAAEVFVRTLINDPRANVKLQAEAELLKQTLAAATENKQQRANATDDALAFFRPRLEETFASLHALRVVQLVRKKYPPEEAAEFYHRMGKLFATSYLESEFNRGQEFIKQAAGWKRLLSGPVELSGQTMDGPALDWNRYRGKIVLIEFWSTTCGPCMVQFPNIEKHYEKYHSRGFEVVGVPLDNEADLAAFLKKRPFPWPTLRPSPKESEQNWDHPLAQKYAVSGIPTAILLDQTGKVVDLDARGERLTKHLEELIERSAEAKPSGK
ncbi:MAG: TlpA family protein disulfide reductase [Planctomycetes bacterium]|nr:TlpA family protein disulfide reductase [Planctomycetota bacterium]